MRSLLWLAVLTLTACLPAPALLFAQDKKEQKKDDKDKKDDKGKKDEPKKGEATVLEGTWSVVSMEYGDKKMEGDKVKGMVLVFEGNQLTIKRGAKTIGKGTFTLDGAQKPAHMDYREGKDITSGWDTAIFHVDGGALRLCTTADRKKRPTDFDSKQGQVVVLKKVKE
jgi:uncharacterized protein (TIGR03067 family)